MEKKDIKGILIRYSICIAVSALLVVGVLFIRDYFHQTELSQKYRYMSDAFTISGFIFILVSGLIFVSDEGAFDGIGFALKSAIRVIIPMTGIKKAETYQDYRERKHAKGKLKGFSCVFFTGIVNLIVGIIFTILFFNV